MTPILNEESIIEMTQQIWTALLSDQGRLVPGGRGQGDISATVDIKGAWNGTACLSCSERAARHAAGVMFEMSPEDLSACDISDAVGELINVVGGNIKGILPAPTELSLPTVYARGAFQLPGDPELEYQVDFTWLDEPIIISVWSQAP